MFCNIQKKINIVKIHLNSNERVKNNSQFEQIQYVSSSGMYKGVEGTQRQAETICRQFCVFVLT